MRRSQHIYNMFTAIYGNSGQSQPKPAPEGTHECTILNLTKDSLRGNLGFNVWFQHYHTHKNTGPLI